jgi:hypothetical protein
MTYAYVKATEKKGYSITQYPAVDMERKGCTTCKSLFKTEDACSFGDDF